MTNAVYTKSAATSGTYVMSATQRRFGAARVEVTFQQVSGPLPAGSPGTVVRGLFRPAAAPAMPSSRISRSTVHRATSMPCAVQLQPHFPRAVNLPALPRLSTLA